MAKSEGKYKKNKILFIQMFLKRKFYFRCFGDIIGQFVYHLELKI